MEFEVDTLGFVAGTVGLLLKVPLLWPLFRQVIFTLCTYNPRRRVQSFALLKNIDLHYMLVEVSGQIIALTWNLHHLHSPFQTYAELYPLVSSNSLIICFVLLLRRRYWKALLFLFGLVSIYFVLLVIMNRMPVVYTDLLIPWSGVSIIFVLWPGVWFAYKRKSAAGLSPWMLSLGLLMGLIRVYTAATGDSEGKVVLGTVPGPALTLIMLCQFFIYRRRRRVKRQKII
jgi:hypothetical protein